MTRGDAAGQSYEVARRQGIENLRGERGSIVRLKIVE